MDRSLIILEQFNGDFQARFQKLSLDYEERKEQYKIHQQRCIDALKGRAVKAIGSELNSLSADLKKFNQLGSKLGHLDEWYQIKKDKIIRNINFILRIQRFDSDDGSTGFDPESLAKGQSLRKLFNVDENNINSLKKEFEETMELMEKYKNEQNGKYQKLIKGPSSKKSDKKSKLTFPELIKTRIIRQFNIFKEECAEITMASLEIKSRVLPLRAGLKDPERRTLAMLDALQDACSIFQKNCQRIYVLELKVKRGLFRDISEYKDFLMKSSLNPEETKTKLSNLESEAQKLLNELLDHATSLTEYVKSLQQELKESQ